MHIMLGPPGSQSPPMEELAGDLNLTGSGNVPWDVRKLTDRILSELVLRTDWRKFGLVPWEVLEEWLGARRREAMSGYLTSVLKEYALSGGSLDEVLEAWDLATVSEVMRA